MKRTITYRNPVAKAMLQERKSPQVVPPKKGGKAKRNRKQEKMNDTK